MTEPFDADVLIERSKQGDLDALRCLLLRHHDQLLTRLSAKFPSSLRSVSDPEDVLQVTYADAADAIGSFQSTGTHSFLAWLTKIGERNLTDLIRFHRAAKRGGNMIRRSADDDLTSNSDDWYSFMFQESLTPSRAVARDEAIAALHLALSDLKPDYRQVIELRYLSQLDDEQIAEKMGRPASTIHGLCFRAMRKLRERMGRFSRFFTST